METTIARESCGAKGTADVNYTGIPVAKMMPVADNDTILVKKSGAVRINSRCWLLYRTSPRARKDTVAVAKTSDS